MVYLLVCHMIMNFECYSALFVKLVQCRVIVSIRSGKLSFHDWKSQGKVREFYCGSPVGTLEIEKSTGKVFGFTDSGSGTLFVFDLLM